MRGYLSWLSDKCICMICFYVNKTYIYLSQSIFLLLEKSIYMTIQMYGLCVFIKVTTNHGETSMSLFIIR